MILENTIIPVIEPAKVELYCGMPVPGQKSLYIRVTLRHRGHHEKELCSPVRDMSLFGRFLIPVCGLFVVPRYAYTNYISIAKRQLCSSVPLFGCFLKPVRGLFVVLRYAYTNYISIAKRQLCSSVPLFGCFLKPVRGLFVVLRYGFTISVHPTKPVLRLGVTLLGLCQCLQPSDFVA